MTSALSLLRTHGSALKDMSRKGTLSKTALIAAGSAILAAHQVQAEDACPATCETDGEGIVTIGQSLIGATHSHQSGLTHNHGPLSILPMGPDHAHPVSGMVAGGVAPGGVLMGGGAPAAMATPVMNTAAMNAPIPGPMASAPSAPMTKAMAYTPPPAPIMSAAMASPVVPAPMMPTTIVSAPLMVTPYNANKIVASSPSLFPGVNVDAPLLLTLGLAGLTGLSALVLFGGGEADAGSSSGGAEYKPYVSSGSDADPSGIVITSAPSQLVDEGETGTFSIISATDEQGDTLTFAITGGADQARFTVDTYTGALSFIGADLPSSNDPSQSEPDYSAISGDADDTQPENGNNTLELIVQVSDPSGNARTQALTYYIQNDDRDDRVEDYKLASQLARVSDTDTNFLTDMIDAAFGRDSNGDVLVLSVDGGDRVSVTELNGMGGATLTSFGTTNADYVDIALGDIDGDGRLDAVVAAKLNGENIVQLWESNGLGQFSLELTALEGSGTTDLDATGSVTDVVIGEFTGSGNLDIFVSNDGGDDSLITVTGNYSGTILTESGLEAGERSAVISEDYINSSTDYVVSIDDGDLALIDVEDMEREDLLSGTYVDLAVYRDKVFAANSTTVDVFQADTNSLDDEKSALVTGHSDIVKILLGDFDDNHTDVELAVLDRGEDTLSIYDMDRTFDSAPLLYTIDVDASAETLLAIPQSVELATALTGNLADEILVGGPNSALYYDDSSL